MPTARPFAMNTGSTINGTQQFGNLAVGTPTSGFDSTGLRWWNGPDEDSGYVIAQETLGGRSTPDGVTAYLGFWRTGTKTESDLIYLSNFISAKNGTPQEFTGATQAKTWLVNNGYWTSYVGSSGYTPTCFTIDSGLSLGENAYFMEYSPTSEEIYICTFVDDYGPLVVDSNTLKYKGTLPITGTSSNGQFAIDVANNKLFTGQVNANYVVKYDLTGIPVSGRTIEAAVTPYPSTGNIFQIVYNPVHDKLYVANDDYKKVYVLSGSNLTTIAEIINPNPDFGEDGPINLGVNTNNGNVIFTIDAGGSAGSYYNYFIIDGDTNDIIYTGYTNSPVPYENPSPILFSPVSNKFYLIHYLGGYLTNKVIEVIDANTGEFLKTITLTGSVVGQQDAFIYDSKRNYIWTPKGDWFVIDCNTDEIVLQFEETLACGTAQKGGYFAVYDSGNDRMITSGGSTISKKYFELNDIIPWPNS